MKTAPTKDPHRILLEEGHLIDEAVRKAAREALLQHRREGLPVAIYRDGNVVWVDPNDLDVE